jgi:Uma2 family endonuclease
MQEVVVKSDYESERGKPIPSKNHGIIQGKITFLLMLHYSEKYEIASEVNVMINEQVKVPDIAIFDDVQYTPGYDEINVTEIPVGVVEILSPKQSMVDLIAKSYEYFEAGVQSYWLVLPEVKTIFVYHAPNEYEAYVKTGILKDIRLNIELDIAQIFAERKQK